MLRWRYGIVAGIFLAIFSLYPQAKLVYNRGWSEWNGNYAYNDIDEVAYAAYINALIDGRPRKNDPYTGRDDSPEDPQPESLFSIQFAAPYTVALPARVLGVGAPWAMTISGALAAFLAALAVFWLIAMITRGDGLYAMAGALAVLAGGALFAGEGAVLEILFNGFSYPYFPGLRRYIPAMAMPAFFLLVGVVWKLNGNRDDPAGRQAALSNGRVTALVVVAMLAFAYCVFSYFYIWTTAAAWLGVFGLLLLILRPDGFKGDIKKLALIGAGCLAALIPYFYLLSKRSTSLDEVQMLVRTRAPDLLRMPEMIGFGVLIAIGALIWGKQLELRSHAAAFAASLALTPLVVFNQQVITGQSLQPIHYQVFIGNYVAGLAVMVTFALVWPRIRERQHAGRRVLVGGLAAAAVIWGFAECHYTVRVLDEVNIARDEALPAARRLAELGSAIDGVHKQAVIHFGIAEADDLPTTAPQQVLWARHQHVFAGESFGENKLRYYQLLYYSGVEPGQLASGIKNGTDIVSMIALFGWGRHTDRLNSEYKPLTFGEVDAEARKYADYASTFDARTTPGAVVLSYAITLADQPENALENLDRWYERTTREDYGRYVLYKLRQR